MGMYMGTQLEVGDLILGKKLLEGFFLNLSICRICMLHFCSGSPAQKVRDAAMNLKDRMHNRSVHLSVYWVSLFTAKKHLISRDILCQMKYLHIWNQSRGWALKLRKVSWRSEKHQLWPGQGTIQGSWGLHYIRKQRLIRFCIQVTQLLP